MKLSLQLYDSPDGNLIADWGGDAVDVVMSTGSHGFMSLTFTVPMSVRDQFVYYNLQYVPHIEIASGGLIVWEGRVEDWGIGADGLSVLAMGYWREFYSGLYTALWSDTNPGNWFPLTVEDATKWDGDRYSVDTNNRLYIAPRKGEVFNNTGNLGAYGYQTPDAGERQIVGISFNYEMAGSSSWIAKLRTASSAWADSATNEWTLTGNGTTQTGSGSVTWSGTDRAVLFLYYNNGTATEFTGETGNVYIKLTNIRVKTSSSSSIYADEIAGDLLSYINTLNGIISLDTTLVQSPGVDIKDFIAEDLRPGDILNGFARYGDDQSPPRIWECGVWEGRRLYFRPYGEGAKNWSITINTVVAERSIDTLFNSVYALYDGTRSGRKERTAKAADNDSIYVYGITREGKVDAATRSETTAGIYRDAFLEDNRDVSTKAEIQIRDITGASGEDAEIWEIRAGDMVTIQNLPPSLGELDDIRTFNLERTEANLSTRELKLTPLGVPSLEFVINRSS